MMPFSMTLNDPNPGFKVTPLFDVECLTNGKRDIVTMKYVLMRTYTHPTFE